MTEGSTLYHHKYCVTPDIKSLKITAETWRNGHCVDTKVQSVGNLTNHKGEFYHSILMEKNEDGAWTGFEWKLSEGTGAAACFPTQSFSEFSPGVSASCTMKNKWQITVDEPFVFLCLAFGDHGISSYDCETLSNDSKCIKDIPYAYLLKCEFSSRDEEKLFAELTPYNSPQRILDTCVVDAILSQNYNPYHETDFTTEAHTVLKTVTKGNVTTVYAMVLSCRFSIPSDGALEDTGGSHMPVALTFEKQEDSTTYHLTEYWMPEDGSYYAPSIKTKFPADIYEDALDTQKYIRQHMQTCYDKAIQACNINVQPVLAKLLEEITSSPAESSNPQAYIKTHPIEYRELLYYGNHTLQYASTHKSGLEGKILELAVQDIQAIQTQVAN